MYIAKFKVFGFAAACQYKQQHSHRHPFYFTHKHYFHGTDHNAKETKMVQIISLSAK